MAVSEFEAVVAVMREHLWHRLGLMLDEFYTPTELAERWIAHGRDRGDSAATIADAFARSVHEKYALEWMSEVKEVSVGSPGARQSRREP